MNRRIAHWDQIEIVAHVDESSCILQAMWDQRFTVGTLKAIFLDNQTVRVDDLNVNDSIPARNSIFAQWVRQIFRAYGMKSFRQKGVGSSLMKLFREICEERNVSRIFGHVVEHDARQSPFLCEWYQRLGFRVLPPTDSPFRDTVATIEWLQSSASG